MTSPTKLRTTVQRSTILEAVRQSRDHPTAEEVHQRVRRKVRHVSLGTVYRNLARLDQAGEIRQLYLSGEPARFDGEVSRHDHVRCSRCRRVEDVAASASRTLQERAAAATGYRIDDYRIEFNGLCPQCRQRAGS